MKKYKIIKTYPGSDKLGTVITLDKNGECWTTPQLVVESDCKNNPEFFEEIIQKDYEILSFICTENLHTTVISKGTILCKTENSKFENGIIEDVEVNLLKYPHWKIFSIKRKSDNEVFSIGDNVDSKLHKNHYKITEIKLFNEVPIIVLSSKDVPYELSFNLSNIIKSKPVFLITEDGVKVNLKGEIHWVSNYVGGEIKYLYATSLVEPHLFILEDFKVFSSFEKAQEWIILNKPVLSINDVLGLLEEKHQKPLWKWSCTTQTVLSKFKEVVKSRL